MPSKASILRGDMKFKILTKGFRIAVVASAEVKILASVGVLGANFNWPIGCFKLLDTVGNKLTN